MKFRSIDDIKEIIEKTGLNISYLYDDLIFVQNNAYLIRFNDEDAKAFFLHFNEESELEERPKIMNYLQRLAMDYKITITESQLFRTQQNEDETFQIQFLN